MSLVGATRSSPETGASAGTNQSPTLLGEARVAPTSLRAIGAEIAAIAALAALVLLFNPDLSFRGMVPAGYDTFVYFYPLRAFFAQSLAEGRLPQWNPYLFAGAPYLANPQAAVFYPGTAAFAFLPVPKAYSVNLMAHLFLAAASFYGFARWSLSLGRVASVLGGASLAFSGFTGGQAGHLNQLSVAAWLPAAALTFDLSLRTRSVWAFVALVGVLVMQLLAGHPQEVYMTLAALGVVAIWRRWGTGPRGILSGMAVLAAAVAVAVGISAVQLLPTAELARLSIRGGGLEYEQAIVESLPWQLILPALLPGYWSHLHSTELFAHTGAIVIVIAWVGLLAGPFRAATLGGAMVLLGLGLAVGHANPLYRPLFDWAPGFGSFRVPARWLMLYTFGACILIATGIDWLMRSNPRAMRDENGLSSARFWSPISRLSAVARVSPFRLAIGLCVPLAFALLVVVGEKQSRWLLATWFALGSLALALVVVSLMSRRLRMVALSTLVVVALAEQWVAGADLELRHPMPELAYGQARPSTEYLAGRPGLDGDFRMLSIASPEYEVKETPEYRERFAWLHPEALKNLLVAVKWNETLWPNLPLAHRLASADGYDGGVLPLANFSKLATAMLGPDRARPDGVLASRLDSMPDERWLDLLGVRYVLAGRIKDLTRDALYYDRAISRRLGPGESLEIGALPLGDLNRVGIISSHRGDPAPGRQIGELRLWHGDRVTHTVPLIDGRHTAAARADPASVRGLERVHAWGHGPDDLADWIAEIRFPSQPMTRLEIANTSPDLTLDVRSLNLVDDVRQASFSQVLDDSIHRTEFFDMKLYERRDALPRAYVVPSAEVLDDDAAVRRLSEPELDPRETAILAPGAEQAASGPRGGGGQATIETSEPERLRIRARSDGPGFLVISDSWYPGWRATVDGREAPILRANLLFRAIPLESGEHLVELVYAPTSFWLGAAVSVVVLAGSVIALVGWSVRSRQKKARTP